MTVIASAFVTWPHRPVFFLSALVLILGCVPRETEDTSASDTERLSSFEAPPIPRWRPRPRAHSRLEFELSNDAARSASLEVEDPKPLIESPFREDFDREQLGDRWSKTSERWFLEEGKLCEQYAHNHPLWLNFRLPTNARIEFTAQSFGSDGDIKVEAWGDGKSFARGNTYDDATSYLFILGGWKNTLHVLARLNEHGEDRLALHVDNSRSDARYASVETGRNYRFVIERRDGKTVSWSVDGNQLLSLEDREPLRGSLHEHFGFNGWNEKVCFDNLLITPLVE